MYNQASRPWALAALSGLILMTACMDTPTLPTEVDAQFAKGGGGGGPGKEKPDKTGDPGVWDGTQEIVYKENFTQSGVDGDRFAVVAADGSNRAIVFTAADGDYLLDAEIAPGGNSIVFNIGDAMYRITRDSVTSEISLPELLFNFTNLHSPTLSHDGTKIAFLGFDPAFWGCSVTYFEADLYVHELVAGGGTTRITSNNKCVIEPTTTTFAPAWVSNTEIAVLQSPAAGSVDPHPPYIAAFYIGTVEDVNPADGVIDNLVETRSTLNGGGPSGSLVPYLEWAPDAARGVVGTANPWDFWLVDFSDPNIITSCNITGAIDGSVFEPSLGPDNRIVFRMTVKRRYHLLAGTLGPDCPTSLALSEFDVFDPSKGKDYWYPTSPHWRRGMQ